MYVYLRILFIVDIYDENEDFYDYVFKIFLVEVKIEDIYIKLCLVMLVMVVVVFLYFLGMLFYEIMEIINEVLNYLEKVFLRYFFKLFVLKKLVIDFNFIIGKDFYCFDG